MFFDTFKETLQAMDKEAVYPTLSGDIFVRYSEPGRKYHTPDHLDKLTAELKAVKEHIREWETVVCSIAYHDIIYNVFSSDNEEQSAAYAYVVLKNVLTDQQLQRCQHQILATKHHKPDSDVDTNYFTDADLSILGESPEQYRVYAAAVRAEYGAFADIIYNAGRKKVLKAFLERKSIYKTQHFQSKYEKQARTNIKEELRILDGGKP
jgi:predicted metal-dependent HD superfamily phosphohydrolase